MGRLVAFEEVFVKIFFVFSGFSFFATGLALLALCFDSVAISMIAFVAIALMLLRKLVRV
jgi:hypothetical protein